MFHKTNLLRPFFPPSRLLYRSAVKFTDEPKMMSKKVQFKKEALEIGIRVRDDFESLTDRLCSCPDGASSNVIFSHGMVDILRKARRFPDPLVVGLETKEKGARLFMATHRRHMFHHLCYLRLKRPNFSTWHEIMTDLTRLRLYFDMEYYVESNPDVMRDEMLSAFRKSISRFLTNYFDLPGDDQESKHVRIVELDASIETKFSRHMIIHMKDSDGREIGFESAAELREFLTKPIVRMITREGFYVRPKDHMMESVPLIDLLACHGKPGQNFRLLGSPKFGMQNTLNLVDVPIIDGEPHDFRFHDPECPICQQTFDDSLVTISKTKDRVFDEESNIKPTNLDAYRQEINEFGVDLWREILEKFGIRCAFYYEIHQFSKNIDRFEKPLIDNLLGEVVKFSHKSEFYQDLANEKSMKNAVHLFENFKRTLRSDPIHWDSIYAQVSDLLEIFHLTSDGSEESPATDQSPNNENIFITRYSAARRRATQVRQRYINLMKYSSANYDDWTKKKEEILQLTNGSKADKLRQYMEDERGFGEWARNRLDELKKRNEMSIGGQRGVEMALDHSKRILDDYGRRVGLIIGKKEDKPIVAMQ